MAFFSNALCPVKPYRAPIQETVRRTQASRSLFSPRCHFTSTRRPILGSATSASARSQSSLAWARGCAVLAQRKTRAAALNAQRAEVVCTTMYMIGSLRSTCLNVSVWWWRTYSRN